MGTHQPWQNLIYSHNPSDTFRLTSAILEKIYVTWKIIIA